MRNIQISSERIIHPKRRIKLPFISGPVFQLRPPPNRIQASHFGIGRGWIATEHRTASNSAVEPANSLAPIQLSAQ